MEIVDWDEIRRAIYEALGYKGECRAYRVIDGSIFIYRGSHLEDKFDPYGDWDIDKEEWTPEEKSSAVQISCTDCPNFDECPDIDSLVEDYEEKYGEPMTVEDVKKTQQKKRKNTYKISSPQKATYIKLSPYKIDCPFCQAVIEVSGDINDVVTNCPACGEEIYVTKEDALKERRSRSKNSYNIRCPFCEQKIEVPSELDNSLASCPACGEELYLTREDAVD